MFTIQRACRTANRRALFLLLLLVAVSCTGTTQRGTSANDAAVAHWRPPTASDDPATKDALLRQHYLLTWQRPARTKQVEGSLTDENGSPLLRVLAVVTRSTMGDPWTSKGAKSKEEQLVITNSRFKFDYHGWDRLHLQFFARDTKDAVVRATHAVVDFSSANPNPPYTPLCADSPIRLATIMPDEHAPGGLRVVLRTSAEWDAFRGGIATTRPSH
jgi:hypothetical protein